MKNKRIGVLFGGISSEREISLRSGKNIISALEKLGYTVIPLDITTKDCAAQISAATIDIAFNILHGEFGEDGGIQRVLEELEIPYTGSGISASENCMHKIKCKRILSACALPTAKFEQPNTAADITMEAPVVIKAADQGSSIGVTIVKKQTDVIPVFTDMCKKFNDVFLEEFVAGAEVTVGVMEDAGKIIALPILELVPKNDFYDFEAKYTPGRTDFVLPANLSPEVTKHVQELAVKAFTLTGCAGAARVDFVIKDRQTPYILEINTVPGMTDQSDLPAEAKCYGYTFEQLVEKILHTAQTGKF